jgi:hypothetical protein
VTNFIGDGLKTLSKGEVAVVADSSAIEIVEASPINNGVDKNSSRICWGIAPEPRLDELVHLAAMERLSKLPTDDLLTTKIPSEFELIAPRNLRVIVFPTETSQLSFDSAPVNDDDSNKENASSTRFRIYSSGDQPCLIVHRMSDFSCLSIVALSLSRVTHSTDLSTTCVAVVQGLHHVTTVFAMSTTSRA